MESGRNLLFLNRVYPPAEGATGELLRDLAAALAKDGWQVTVVTGKAGKRGISNIQHRASHTENRERAGDPLVQNSKCNVRSKSGVGNQAEPAEDERGIRVERVRGLPFTRANHLKRAFSYFSLYPALFWRALRIPLADRPVSGRTQSSSSQGSPMTDKGIIITLTDPPLLLVLGPFLKWFKKCKLIHWAQDIYPEVAEELGVTNKGGFLARLLRRLSTWALRRQDLIIVVGRCMQQRLLQRGVDPGKIVVIPNWAQAGNRESKGEAPEFRSTGAGTMASAQGKILTQALVEKGLEPVLAAGENFRRQHGLTARFVVMYSGNFGLAHPFGAIVSAIGCFEKKVPQILFVFIGSGPRLSWLTEQLKDRANVRFFPFQPKEKLGESLAAADLHLASMNENLCGLVVPSKIYGILAAERPCVFIGPKESEAAQILTEFECGTVVASSDHAGLISAIGEYASNADRLRQARANTRNAMNDFASALGAFKKALQLKPPLSKN